MNDAKEIYGQHSLKSLSVHRLSDFVYINHCQFSPKFLAGLLSSDSEYANKSCVNYILPLLLICLLTQPKIFSSSFRHTFEIGK